jgi:hypothetical protein
LGLLQHGLDTTATVVWQKVLSIANDWEKNNIPTTIYKGTAYFFLAENYLLIGDRDLAFLYLYSALNDDIYLGKMSNSLNYPRKAPSYLTVTMKDDKDNQMYYWVELLRNRLGQYISEFNNEYRKCFKIDDFDTKFLDNKDLADVVSFFVYHFLYLFDVERKLMPFSKCLSNVRSLFTMFADIEFLTGHRDVYPEAEDVDKHQGIQNLHLLQIIQLFS